MIRAAPRLDRLSSRRPCAAALADYLPHATDDLVTAVEANALHVIDLRYPSIRGVSNPGNLEDSVSLTVGHPTALSASGSLREHGVGQIFRT